MNTTILSSTFLLTMLLSVGLFFFIRASVKDRTQVVTLISERSPDSLAAQLQQYFAQRAYRVTTLDAERNQVTFEGFVRPSWFLAIFLTLLAALGILCLALDLSLIFPQGRSIFLGLTFLSPLTGIFYWQKAGRTEQVSLQFQNTESDDLQRQSLITVTAHRDELEALRRSLHLQSDESSL